jgi:hypothetical protein
VQIQTAYEQVTAQRKRARPSSTPPPPRPSPWPPRPSAGDPAVEARLADLERQVEEARAAKERAAQAARDALREVQGDEDLALPADDEDSFSKLLADAAAQLGERVDGAREHPAVRRATEMLAGLEWLASGANAERSRRDGEKAGDDDRRDRSGGSRRLTEALRGASPSPSAPPRAPSPARARRGTRGPRRGRARRRA